jgi:hypothetical protein
MPATHVIPLSFLDRLLNRNDSVKSYLSDLERWLNDALPLHQFEMPTSDGPLRQTEEEVTIRSRLEKITSFDPRVSKVEVKDLQIQKNTMRCTIELFMRSAPEGAARACRAEYGGERWICRWSDDVDEHVN